MSRLFIGPKEVSFIHDITAEFMKDVVGQYIIYYPISTMKTQVHPIYDEAIEKIFENPIKLDVLAGQPDWETKYTMFGNEQSNKIEIFIQVKDLINKNIEVQEGDFFVYGEGLFEIQSAIKVDNIFGQAEYYVSYKLEGKLARKGQFDVDFFKQILSDNNPDFTASSVQKVFEQQRGLPVNETEGITNDHREMRERLKDDFAEVALGEGPRKVAPQSEDNDKTSSFEHDSYYKIYDE